MRHFLSYQTLDLGKDRKTGRFDGMGIRFYIIFCADRIAPEMFYPICTFHPWHGVERGVGSGREAPVYLSGRWWAAEYVETASWPLPLPCHPAVLSLSLQACSHVLIRMEATHSLLIILVKGFFKILALMSQN